MIYTLVVKASTPRALPCPHWEFPENCGKIFGFQLAYYNPNLRGHRPQILSTQCIGFYEVCEPFPTSPIFGPDDNEVELVAVTEGSPAEVSAKLLKIGLVAFLSETNFKYYYAPKAVGATA